MGKKGPDFERATADYWKDNHQHPAAEFIDRRTKTGAKDKGDVSNVRIGDGMKVVVEAKSVVKLNFSGWLKEAEVERANDEAWIGIVIAKRKGYGKPEDQYAVMTQADLLRILALIPPNTLPA